MALVDFTPFLPTYYRMSVDQNDLPHLRLASHSQEGIEGGAEGIDGVVNVRRCAGGRDGDIGFDCFQDGGEEGLFIVEMMIEGASADARFPEDRFRGGAIVSRGGEQAAGGLDDAVASRSSFFDFFVHTIDRPTDCL